MNHYLSRFDPTKPISGTVWFGKPIYFDDRMMVFSIGDSKHLTRKQLYEVMYEMKIEYENGEITEIFDIVVEPYSAIIKWMMEDMVVDQLYPVNNNKQLKLMMNVWDVLHIQDEFVFEFLNDYTEIIKRNKE